MAGRPVQRQPVLDRVVLGTQRVGRTQPHRFERLIQVPPQRLRLAQGDQPPERPLAVRGGGVEQDARHRLLVAARRAGVDPLPDARRRVAALDGELADQGVGQRVQEHVPHRRESVVRVQAPVLPPPPVGLEELALLAPWSS